mgnify:FL=1
MTALQGSPRFTGFIRRLVEEGHVSAEKMREALLSAQKANQDIVAYLTKELNIPSLTVAETISAEFGEPIFDISAYDANLIIREDIDEKLITRYRVLPIYKHASTLYVATSNPTNIEAVDAIRFSSKMNTETIIVEHHKLEKLIEQQFAQFLAEFSPAGLACDMNDMPALAQGFRHPLDMTALSCTVDSLESDEFAFHFPPL